MKPRLRIRSKLFLWLIIAGLIPLVAVSAVGLLNITDRLKGSIRKETRRNLRIAMNLVLRQVQKVSADADQLGHTPDILEITRLRSTDPRKGGSAARLAHRARKVLERKREELSSGLVEFADIKGYVFARHSLGEQGLLQESATPDSHPFIMRGLDYEHHINLVPGKRYVLLKAVSPIVDSNFNLLGAVVLTMPMDRHLADLVRATLGVHVGFYIKRPDGKFVPTASSIVGAGGKRFVGFTLKPAVAKRALAKKATITVARTGGQSFLVGVMPLVNAEPEKAPQEVGLLAVAVDRQAVVESRGQAINAMILVALLVLALALTLAYTAARSLSRPLAQLHSGAAAVARGDLEHSIPVDSSDEIGELAEAFNTMTASLRENQKRLAARISEIITLHTIGRAVSSVMGLDEVLRTVIEETTRALGAEVAALFLNDDLDQLHLTASVGLREDTIEKWDTDGPPELAIGTILSAEPASCEDVERSDTKMGELAQKAGFKGSVMTVPLEQKDRVMGAIIINRQPPAAPFGEGELRLLSTFADQAGTAIDNARLYEEVRVFSERLEQMVEERTAELTEANRELAKTLEDLQETQSQLILSERLAGLGNLVAGIAHEVNTPAAAIQGAADNLDRNTKRLVESATEFATLRLKPEQWIAFMDVARSQLQKPPDNNVLPPAEARVRSQKLQARMDGMGVPNASRLARRLTDIGLADAAEQLLDVVSPEALEPLLGAMMEMGLLRRNANAIGTAIKTINRIVTALRAYSHLDQTRVDRVNIHDGIETTLVILANRLKYDIETVRRYGELPPMPVYVDELNQVWTNLVVNAADSIQEAKTKGKIIIETENLGEEAVVRIIDDGPGIPADILPRIFKPFFTTKPKGRGTGLGLGIVQRIINKHGGRIEAESEPGKTVFAVYLPVAGPPPLAATKNNNSGARPEGSTT